MPGVEDRLAIHELMALYGHIIDERQFGRVGELFAPGARYDVSSFGAGVHVGVEAIVELWTAAETRHPLAHHATNVVITEDDSGAVRVLSKGLGLLPGGRVGSVSYRDVVRLGPEGWRIAERIATARDTAGPASPQAQPDR